MKSNQIDVILRLQNGHLTHNFKNKKSILQFIIDFNNDKKLSCLNNNFP